MTEHWRTARVVGTALVHVRTVLGTRTACDIPVYGPVKWWDFQTTKTETPNCLACVAATQERST